MAQRTGFTYHDIRLFKTESLGSGSYGGVCKAKCDGLLCAAKIMHPTLFDLNDPGTVSYLRKFQEECHLLSLARHPNVVQYLATYHDPDTRLPVLIMELCDESLTAFLERSPGPLSYHIQLNICHDITLALVYLHSNGLIHRDLTGNNILMIAGARAKVTDFGMSKLATVNPRMTALTLCPGNVLYMSPEALDEAKAYTAKLDIFSFGVIVIQILTRQFPSPTDRFRLVHVSDFDEEVRVLVSEIERREAHLKLIPNAHSLKPLAIQCLKKKENERPSALQLSEWCSVRKQSSEYTESKKKIHQALNSSEISGLQTQLQEQKLLLEAKIREYQAHITELQSMHHHTIQVKDIEIMKHQQTIASMQHALEMKESELQQSQKQLQTSQELVLQSQQRLQQQEKTAKRTISANSLEEQDTVSRVQPQQESLVTPLTKMVAAQKDISSMTWREGKNAPEKMARGTAVAHKNRAYFIPADSSKVYSYHVNEEWSQLPDSSNWRCGLAVINGVPTIVGGYNDEYTNALLSLTGEGGKKKWSKILPPMPTPRYGVACITTDQALVVAGGHARDGDLATVEVMNVNTRQWMTACPLPQKQSHLSGVACGNTLYLAAGSIGFEPSKSVSTCLLSELLSAPNTLRSKMRRALSKSNVWKEVSSSPLEGATLAELSGHLLAIGGKHGTWNCTTDVYRYDPDADSWSIVSQMKKRRSWCLAVTLPEDRLIILGGYARGLNTTDSIEILQ